MKINKIIIDEIIYRELGSIQRTKNDTVRSIKPGYVTWREVGGGERPYHMDGRPPGRVINCPKACR